MRFLSVCSGIEAASVAWRPLGWAAAAVAEIEPFPCHVLADRHGASRPLHMPDPDAPGLTLKERRRRAAAIKAVSRLPEYRPGSNLLPNFGDMEAFKEWPDADVDVLVGGTPCQSFSVAGLRKGLDDPRGNLALVYLAVAARYRPRWIVWENVPGVLSSNDGRDFGAFLGALGQLGYGWAYRVLDAQYVRTRMFGGAVPQRRRRVFVVGYLGDWRRAAAVLFEPEGLQGHPPPRREAGSSVAALTANGVGTCGADDNQGQAGHLIAHDVAPTLNAHFGDKMGLENQHINGGCGHFVAHALRGEGFDASEDGTGRGTPLVPVAFAHQAGGKQTTLGASADGTCQTLGAHQTPAVAFAQNQRGELRESAISPQLTTGGGKPGQGQPVIAFDANGSQVQFDETGIAPPLRSMGHDGSHANAGSHAAVATRWAVRRLTPLECERLQGFPDGYTDVPYGRRNRTPDGPRYKALGNSMAVNAMEWIGERIAMVDGMGGDR